MHQIFLVFGVALLLLIAANVWFFCSRRQAATDLRQSQQMFERLFEEAPYATILVDRTGCIARANAQVETLFGYARHELLGQGVETLLPERFRARHSAHLSSYFVTPHPRAMGAGLELFGRRKDGSEFSVDIMLSPLETGEAPQALAVIRNVTEQKKTEEELRAAHAVAQESVRLKSQFLAHMSHEIRTPMNGVIGMTGLLLDTNLTADQRVLADTVRTSADALLRIINDILDFSKIEAGLLTFEAAPFDLRDPIENCLTLLAEQAHAKALELAYLIEEDVPTQLFGDAGRVHQVLVNLVSNAVKFTEKGEVILNVTKVADHDRRVCLRFAVRDTGIGIAPEAQEKLFQPFVQVGVKGMQQFGGTGLGLAISKHLVTIMGGEIGLKSVPGGGSTFWFTAEFPKQEAARKVVVPNGILAGLRALVVDDNETNREILTRQLRGWRMESKALADARHALPVLRAAAESGKPFHVVILDQQMPDMTGLEFTHLLRREPEFAGVKTLILTSMRDLIPQAELDSAGVDACLLKPVRPSRFHDALIALLIGRPAEPLPATPLGLTATPAVDARLRILLAEDNLVNQNIARTQLVKCGYHADLVGNGLEAIEAARARPYDVIIMDCEMPELNGNEATRRLRAWEAERRGQGETFTPLHIIAMTAHAMQGDREACLAAGMDDYISKPVRTAELAAALSRCQAGLR